MLILNLLLSLVYCKTSSEINTTLPINQLVINEPYENELISDQTQYYVVNVADNDIEGEDGEAILIIRVNSPNLLVLASRKCKYVTWECEPESGTNDQPAILQDLKEGKYYISIYAYETSQYQITIEKQIYNQLTVINLQNGKLYQSSVSTEIQRQCFRYKQKKNDTLTINIHGANHKLEYFVNLNDKLPTLEAYDEKSTGAQINVFAKKVSVCVYPLKLVFTQNPHQSQETQDKIEDWMNEDLYQDIPFTIVIFNSDSITTLEVNQPHHSNIVSQQQQVYSFLINYHEDQIFITKQVLNRGHKGDDLKVYIGSNAFDTKEEYEIQFFDHDSSTYQLEPLQIKTLCQVDTKEDDQFVKLAELLKTSDNYTCEIYVLVTTTQKTLRYSLTVHKRDAGIKLDDGQIQYYNLEYIEEESLMRFYFKPQTQLNDINILCSTIFGKLEIFIKIWKQEKVTHKYDWPFATRNDSSADYVSQQTNIIHKVIKKSALDLCWPDCIVLISVGFIDDIQFEKYAQSVKIQEDVIYDDTFHVLVSQLFQDVIEGTPVEISVHHNQFKYFTFKNLQEIEKEENLYISLLSYAGSGYFSVTVNGPENMTVPHILGPYDFHADGPYLQIRKENLFKVLKDKSISLADAYLLIEVGSFFSILRQEQEHQASRLQLLINFIDQDIYNIQNGNPQMIRVVPGKPQIFKFFNLYQQSIKIKLQRTSGYGSMYLWTCEGDDDVNDCIEDTKSKDFKYDQQIVNIGQSGSQIYVDTKDENYCAFCIYLIQVSAHENEINGYISILLEDDFMRLPSGLLVEDGIEKEKHSQYSIQFQQGQRVDVLIQVTNGNPLVYLSFLQKFQKSDVLTKDKNNLIHINLGSEHEYSQYDQPDFYKDNPDSDIKKILPIHFIYDEIFVKIKCDEDCNYTIQYHVGEVGAQLSDGKIHVIPLSQESPISTLFFENYDDFDMYLEIAPMAGYNLSNIELTLNYIKKQSKDDYHLDNIQENIKMDLKYNHSNMITYQLPKYKGLFEIKLNHTQYYFRQQNNITSQQEQTIIEVNMNARDIKIIPYDRSTQGIIDSMEIGYFETYIPSQGFAVFEINTCKSEIEVGFVQDQALLLKEEFDYKFKIPENSYHIEVVEVNKGTLYLGIHDFTTKQANFQIQQHFYRKEKDIPFGKFVAGNDGLIDWKTNQKLYSELFINFTKVECTKCKSLKGFQVDYNVFVAVDKTKLFHLGFCQNSQYDGQDSTKDVIYSQPVQTYLLQDIDDYIVYQLDFSDLITDSQVYVGVMATITEQDKIGQDIKVFYPVIEVAVPNNLAKILHRNRTFFSLVIVLLLFLISLLTIWLCYYMKRLKNLRTELGFKNVVGMNALPSNDDAVRNHNVKMKYDHFEDDQQ
ncbi:hypothetical protein pb186bvf_010835 [Paramecium bursaria]